MPEPKEKTNVKELEQAQKRIEKAAKEQPVSEDTVLQEAAQIQQRKQKELNERMQALLSGKEPPPNDFVNYMLQEMKKVMGAQEKLQKNIQQARHQLQQMEDRMLTLGGQVDKYVNDIQVWDKPIDKGDKPKE